MDYGHPLRFGALLDARTDDPHRALGLAELAEALGYDLVAFPDTPDRPDVHDAWMLLSWVAGRTERIDIAAGVLAALVRPPAVVGRAAASLDLLAGGRLALGLGAGDQWDATAAPGVAPLTGGQWVAALEEAVEIIRGTWDEDAGPLTVPGEHYRVDGAPRGPAPAHNIPLWLGGDEPELLDLVGRVADGWLPRVGAAVSAPVPRAALSAGNAAIDRAAAAAGRDPREIRRLLTVKSGSSPDNPHGGQPERWVEDLLPLAVEEGVATFLLAADDPEMLRRFAGEVAPILREAVAAERAHRGTREGTVPGAAVRARRRPGIDYDHIPAALAGGAIEPGDARYARVRSTYMRGGRPGLVLQVRDAREVTEALVFARAQRVPLSVRSGGHGIRGRSTNDGGIVIDLAPMNRVQVLDEATRRVRVEPGARWGDVAAALEPHGWAITSGDYGGVGVGGLATAGGIGFLGRAHGLTIDHVRSADVVLADGRLVRATATEHPDLFWAVRGAGFTVGIVTALELAADPVGDVGFAQLVFDATDTADFLARWGAAVEAAPRDLTSFLIMGAPRGGQVVAQTMTVIDDHDAATILDRLQPFATLGPLLGQAVQIVPYASVVAPPDPHHGEGEPVTRSALVDHLSPEVAADAARVVRSGATYFFQIRAMGGAISDVDPAATAFAHRAARFSVVAFGSSRDRLDRLWDQTLQQHSTGLYVSFETDRRPERLTEIYPPRTLETLRAIKRRYDPDNVFRDTVDLG